MAENRKTDPKGVDIVIDRIQHLLYVGLLNNGITDYESYPRAYKNRRNNGEIPEYYIGNRNYKEVLMDDKFDITSFFLVSDSRDIGEVVETDISIIFQLDLEKVLPTVTHRADEEFHNLIYLLLFNNSWSYELSEITTGIQNVYNDLDGFNDDSVKWDDISHLHVVKFDISVEYDYSCDSNYVPPVCFTKDIELRFNWDAGDDTTDTYTIDSFTAGSYTAIEDDGGSGDITISVDGGSFIPFVDQSLLVGQTVAFKRTITTNAGYVQINGTY